MDIYKAHEQQIRIKKTITNKIEISEEYFDSVMKKNNICTTINWSGIKPSYNYSKRIKKHSHGNNDEWWYEHQPLCQWEIASILKKDLKEQDIKVKGNLYLDFTHEWDKYDEYKSAKLLGIYFIHTKEVDVKKLAETEIEKQRTIIDRLEYGQFSELTEASAKISALRDVIESN